MNSTFLLSRANGKSFDELTVEDNWNKLGLWKSWVPQPEKQDKDDMIDYLRRLLDEKNNSLVIYI